MYGFLVALHVLAAVLLTGPAVVSPFQGVRALARGDAEHVRLAGRRTMMFGAASLLVFALGMLAVTVSADYDFATPWVVISLTLYLIAVIVGVVVLPGALARAARHLEDRPPRDGGAGPMEVEELGVPSEASVEAGEWLHRARGRLLAYGGLVFVMYAAITLVMSLRP